jgi:sugar phosphate isomerase/epimerase
VAVGFARPAAEVSVELMRDVRAMLSDEGIHVSEFAGVNANLVHPDPAVREQAVERVRAAVGPASALGAACVNSGPGSCSESWRESFYRPDTGNFTPEAEDRAVDTLTRIARVIEDTDLVYTVECHQLTTMRSATIIRRVLDRVDHPRIRANFDPINLLDSAYVAFTNAERIPEFIDTVGPRYAHTCHVKDVIVTDEMPFESHEAPPGQGLVRSETIFAAAQRLPGDQPVDLIVEHLDPKNAEASVELVRQRALEAGITLI